MPTPVDVVYKIGPKCNWENYNELRYSLRSLLNIEGLGKVFIVGHKPEWCQNVIHLPQGDPYKRNKDANLINKMIRVSAHPDLSEEFLWFSDDQYIVTPVKREDFEVPQYDNALYRQGKKDPWSSRALRTIQYLRKRNKPTNIYECHSPYLFNKHLSSRVFFELPFGEGAGMLGNTFYFNFTRSKPGRPRYSHVSIGRTATRSDIDQLVPGKKFMNINHGVNDEIKQWLQDKFPEKSIYEV